jgi:TRAP-type C4-dicarboxylate transport system permease small subunit
VMERSSKFVNKLVEYALFVLGFTMSAVVVAQVFFRYGLNHSLFWAEELSRFLVVWITFLGASVVYRRGRHAKIQILPERFRHGVRSILVDLVALAFFLIMVGYGLKFAYFVRLQVSPAMGVPEWIPHCIIPLSGAILALHALNFLSQNLGEEFK